MKAEKIRNLTDAELAHQQRELADQLFKLKFQLNMGQTESLKKIRGLRKDIARVKTIDREKRSGRQGAWPAQPAHRQNEKKMADGRSKPWPRQRPARKKQGAARRGRRSGLHKMPRPSWWR